MRKPDMKQKITLCELLALTK